MILTINAAFPELNHLSAELAAEGLLTKYVRPYANVNCMWERRLMKMPFFEHFYDRTFGRRRMPYPLERRHVDSAALGWDFLMATHARLPEVLKCHGGLREALSYARTNAIARIGARALTDEKMVVASWGCAEPAFKQMKARGGSCVLNYSLAHHAYTHRYLQEEATLEPGFASTLNSHDRPKWLLDRLDCEIELADHILVGSNFVKASFIAESVPEKKIEVIPYGADTKLFTPQTSEIPAGTKAFRLLFVGQLSQRKGLSYLLRSYDEFHSTDTSLTLVGQLQDDGRALTPWRHLYRYVPPVSRQELADVFRAADVFVFPTLVEGMPLVVIEAMASGLPVITTPNGSGDIVRNEVDGFLIPARDAVALTEKLNYLRSHPDVRREMGRNARARALAFTWDSYRQKVLGKLKEWLNNEDGNMVKAG